MKSNLNLESQISKFIIPYKNKKYWHAYNLLRLKRFLIQTVTLFIFQYLAIIYLRFSYPALPIYPPMGIAFAMFYLFGNRCLLGLSLGGFCAYFLKGLSFASIGLYLTADMGGGFFGAYLCRNIFSSDITRLATLHDWVNFFKANAFTTCVFSAAIRMCVFLMHHGDSSFTILFCNFVDLWLADLNSVLVFAGFLLSWMCVPFSREKITTRYFKKSHGVAFILFIIFSIVFIKKYEFIYFLIGAMIASLYFARLYGNLVSIGLVYVISILYLAYFIVFKSQYLHEFHLELYTLVPLGLLAFILGMFYMSHTKTRQKWIA